MFDGMIPGRLVLSFDLFDDHGQRCVRVLTAAGDPPYTEGKIPRDIAP